jgi:hypothetical protein
MPPTKDTIERKVKWHCDVHGRALEVGEKAVRLVRDGVAGFVCPGKKGSEPEGAHVVEVDADFVPFRLSLVDPELVEVGSGLHPSKQ